VSTKEKPGAFDCYAKLAPDEPYFVLRAKDPAAPATIEAWIRLRRQTPGNEKNPKLDEASVTATAMRAWRLKYMIGQPCGCDPGAKHHCATWPECAFGRMMT
jgi:hypothetical protein